MKNWCMYLATALSIAIFNTITLADESTSAVVIDVPSSYTASRDASSDVITPVEWQELQLDDLVKVISEYAITRLGSIGLSWLINPVKDKAEIENRQRIIRALIEDEVLLAYLEQQLLEIKKGEMHLLKSPSMPLEIENISYHIYAPINALLNRSSLALDMSVLGHLCFVPASLLYFSAVKIASMLHNYDPRAKMMTDTQRDAIAHGSSLIIDETRFLKLNGTAGDRAAVARVELFNSEPFADLVRKHLGTFFIPEGARIPISDRASKILSYCYVYADQARDDLMLLIPCLWIIRLFKQPYDQLVIQQAKYAELAQATRAFDRLARCIKTIVSRAQSTLEAHADLFVTPASWDRDVVDFISILNSNTFNKSHAWFYRPGTVVKATHLHKAVGQKIIPFLQTIAEWDAYCAFARMYKDRQHMEARYCFAEFIDTEYLQCTIDNAWTPLARATLPVGNDIHIGGQGYSQRLFLTGPNGCGKSTYMKAILHGVILAQSCGIVPGSRARLTIFDGIRTSLHPQEDVLQGISTFMAQKLRIDSVASFVSKSSAHYKVLALFDEPFSGTIDSQIDLRVYQLAEQLVQYPYAAVCIATHVERPTSLAGPGKFDNYQVEIIEPTVGRFVRTFKIRPGVAHWWFTDQERVTRFVDWLGNYKK